MKKLLFLITLFYSICTFGQISKIIPARPNPPRLVNDFAGVLTQEQIQSLESKLVAYDDSTSNQIAVVTMKTTGDYDIQEVALQILRDWQVGNKQKNNGVVLLTATDDHKVFIATGYGLEGALPDVTVKSIVDNDIIPGFRDGNYYHGIDVGTNSIIKAAAGEYKAPSGYAGRGGRPTSGGGMSKIAIGILILFIILRMFGGGRGGGGGGMMSRRGSGWLGPMILGSMLSGGSRGGGGFGGFGGGGGGGGFGGFGGGSGGGGGAGGSW